MTENVTGYNTRLARGAATGASLPAFALDTYSDVLDIEELTPPSPSRQIEEFYVLDQKAAKRLVGSITYSAATATLARAFADAIQDSLEDDANADVAVRRNFRITKPDSGNEIVYFTGYVTKFEYSAVSNQGRYQVSIEIVVDGSITIQR